MGKLYDALTPQLITFIENQKMFFVGTAPLAADGHVNISPKGLDTLRILDASTIAYLDMTASGVETIAHVKENGRLVMMFCAFEGRPFTLRLHGVADVLERDHPEFTGLAPQFPDLEGARAIIRLRLHRIADSCGWTVPMFEYVGMRDYYEKHAARLGPEGIREAQLEVNMRSIDGLTGLSKPSV